MHSTFTIAERTQARVTSVSINGENHGKDIQPAVTLSLLMTVPNDWLDNLAKGLKTGLYSKGKSRAEQGELPGTEVSDTPVLRWPEFGALPWTKEYTGLELTIDYGTGGDSDIVVTDCKADNIVLSPKEGGSCEVAFKLKSNKPDEHTRGQLTSTIKRDIEIRVTGPSDGGQQRLDKPAGADDGPWPFPAKGAKGDATPPPQSATVKPIATRSGGKRDATDAFVAQHGDGV